MNSLEQKKELRKTKLIERAQLNSSFKKEYDLWICQQLEQLIEVNNYKAIHAYLPMGKEIDITPLLENLLAKDITIVTPKTLPKRKLENRILTSLSAVSYTHLTLPTIYSV